MALSDYFKDRLNELEQDMSIYNLFRIANRKTCTDDIDHRMIFHNDSVRTYYNKIELTINDYEKSGVFARDDVQELADYLYTYYYVLKYVANNLETEGKQFQYDEKSIDELITEFKHLAERINDYSLRKMCQD